MYLRKNEFSVSLLAELHHIIQMAMDWDDEYLHCFHIYGKDYGISYEVSLFFSDDPYVIYLEDFGFDIGERFTYTYNFYDEIPHILHTISSLFQHLVCHR